MINDLSHPRPIPRLGLGPHLCRPRAPTPYLSQPGPHTQRLIACRSICGPTSLMHRRYVIENSSGDSSIDERDVPHLVQRRSSLHEDSSDDEDDPLPLRERCMVALDPDSDSLSTRTYRQLARRHGWHESSSDSSDGSSVPSLEHDSDDSIENEMRYLLPMVGGTPRNPRPIWFLEDEISYHETSSVSSSASSHASSSSSDGSSHSGQGPFPFEFIDPLHLHTFNDQLKDHMLKGCLTWEPVATPSLSWCGINSSMDVDSHRRPLLSGLTQVSDPDDDSTNSLNSSVRGSDATGRSSRSHDAFSCLLPLDVSSGNASCSLSSNSEITSPSNSDADPDVDHGCGFPVTSNRFWLNQDIWPDQISHTMISHGSPGILHTSSWTPRMMMTGRSRVRFLVDHNNSPTDVYTQLFQDISNIRRNISCPPSWNRIILDHAILRSNCRSSTSSDEDIQHRNIPYVTDNTIDLDSAITESTNRSLTALYEPTQDGTIQADTDNECLSRAPTSRPSMDAQFATLIDIVRRQPLHHPEIAPSDAVSTASTSCSLESAPFQAHIASTMHSSDSYFHPSMTGPIVDRPMSHQDWHDEVCDWFGDESSVSSSYTNDSSQTSTSDTACMSSSSLNLSQIEHDRSIIVTAMSPLSRSLSLISLMETPETFPLTTSSHVDPDTTNRPLTSSDMLSLRQTLSFSNLPETSHPPTHSSAVSFTALTVEEGVSGSTNTYGITHGTQPDHSCARTHSSV